MRMLHRSCVFQLANGCSACRSLVKIICFCIKICYFLHFFNILWRKKMWKVVQCQKMISTSKRHMKHWFSGQNTQHIGLIWHFWMCNVYTRTPVQYFGKYCSSWVKSERDWFNKHRKIKCCDSKIVVLLCKRKYFSNLKASSHVYVAIGMS